MENFFRVRAEKQDHIINAAFAIFGRQGYRKASLGDIAHIAGITKGMITYYFGSKKTLYLYLMEMCQASLLDALTTQISEDTNFFDRLHITLDIQISAIKAHPALLSFINSLYKESDSEVTAEIEASFLSDQGQYDYLMKGIDLLQFKPGIDPQVVCNFILWAGVGFAEEIYQENYDEAKLNEMISQFHASLNLMQKTFTEMDAK